MLVVVVVIKSTMTSILMEQSMLYLNYCILISSKSAQADANSS